MPADDFENEIFPYRLTLNSSTMNVPPRDQASRLV
jgi:hypothetical protein